MSGGKKSSWWDIPVTLAIAVGVVLLITTFVVKPFSIPSGSMENTLLVGDRVLVNRMVYHFRDVQRGDVIVFDGTDSFVPAGDKPQRNPISGAFTWVGQSLGLIQPDSTDFIKRVIGTAGDHVVCCDVQGRITVNGTPLDETYLYPDDVPSFDSFDVVVPEGKLWVMGDHRSNSADSRSHMGDPGGGFVPTSKVIGRAMVVLWPPSEFKILGIPPEFDAIPAPSSTNSSQ
ncbi:MAG: signal peptidase [Actinomycetota bacterium]|jgi:signal peptidase I